MVQIENAIPNGTATVFERKFADHVNFTEQFSKEGDNFTKQFACLYVKRLEQLSPIIKEKLQAKWGNVKLIPLADLEENEGKCAIIGTLYKHQANKPSILQELSEEHQMLPPDLKLEYCSDEDQLFLEDQTSRIKLTGEKVNIKESVTGVVCAVLGKENEKSTFEVEDWCFAGCPLQPSQTLSNTSEKVVLLSGLELATNPPKLPIALLLEWLQGFAGFSEIQEEGSSIVRIVIAGNSIKGCADQHVSRGLVSGKAEDAAAAKEMTEGTQKLDGFLEELGKCCSVTLMPGQFDLTSLMMPQNSMHPGSFPKAKNLSTVTGVTNPWVGKVGKKTIIGTSGQPIQDMQKVCGFDTLKAVDHLERTLEWRHLCPTAPDTVPCLPFYKNDPFIIKECPDIYFAGNMDTYETKMFEGKEGQKIRLICVPKFARTFTAVIVDLNTLETMPISFASQ